MEQCTLGSGSPQWYAGLERSWTITDERNQTVEYFAYSLLSGYASNAEIKGLLNKYDFYIFPVVNPDGTVPS